MTTPGHGVAFYSISGIVPNVGANKVATADCQNNKQVTTSRWSTILGDSPRLYDHPIFTTTQTLVTPLVVKSL